MAVDIDVVLFDLGGVLIELRGIQAMLDLSGITDAEELWRRWLECPWVRRYESGLCTDTEFALGVVDDWNLPISPQKFLSAFAEWPVGPLPGSEQLVREVKAAVPVGCLSNTNALHWRDRMRARPLIDLFEHRFASFELGLLKPDTAIFNEVAIRVGVPPERILFLDDNKLNVDGATSAGIRAATANGVSEARAHLVAAGILAN